MTKISLTPATEKDVAEAMAAKNAAPIPPTQESVPAPVPPVQGEKPVEKPAEEKPKEGEKKDDKPADEKPKRKSIKETIKPFYEKKETVVDEKPKPESAWDEKQVTTWKSIAEDTDVQVLLEVKKNGGDIFAMLKEAQGIDPTTFTPEQLYEMKLKGKGIDGDDLVEAMEDFRAKKPYEQKDLTADFKASLQKESEARKADFLSRLKSGGEQSKEQEKKVREATIKTQTEYASLVKESIGKTHKGITVTPQMAESLENIISGGLIRKNDDGSLDARELYDLAFYKLFEDLIFTELENQYTEKGFSEYEKEVNVTGDAAKSVHSPQPATFTSDKERSNQLVKNLQPVR